MIIVCSITYCNGACQGFNKKKSRRICVLKGENEIHSCDITEADSDMVW